MDWKWIALIGVGLLWAFGQRVKAAPPSVEIGIPSEPSPVPVTPTPPTTGYVTQPAEAPLPGYYWAWTGEEWALALGAGPAPTIPVSAATLPLDLAEMIKAVAAAGGIIREPDGSYVSYGGQSYMAPWYPAYVLVPPPGRSFPMSASEFLSYYAEVPGWYSAGF